ncbi:type VI secretion system membrane subunit TssM [Aureimonas sp. ME7]|uniref:type VI secretion system membrane subunit TssM n=1 Tax=Aureimonas sp. ME7 TaxID=2744252 RepID=UPI0015F6A016|nr:type VI secretion system membrane subunit TssM [Aureimonas sp. ME7]
MNPLNLFYTIRAYVDSYAGIVGRRFLSLIWVVAIAVVVWFYGPMMGSGTFRPLEPALHRLYLIGAVFAAWVVYIAVAYIRGKRADKAMIDAIAEDGAGDPGADQRAEVDALRTRLREAMATLRKVAGRRFGYIYELPWYVMMGAPGSGKTTGLIHSGLKFPLGTGTGGEPIGGVGGTRHCDWWFAEEAIVIDTAGRYTTQGDFSGVDKAGWTGFLQLLRRHRRSQPVNGVLVTLSIPDLLHRDPALRLEEVRAIRQRLSEMDDILKARVPVYLVLTKADLLEGFVPFFDGLARTERDQVWGTTFELALSQEPRELPDRFLAEFDLLRERIDALLLERLQQEPDIDQRGRIFQLPAEVSRLREPVHEVLTELTSHSRLVAAPLVRGIYLASGTQDEAPEAATSAARSPRSMRRSYFLSRLFHEVIFAEAALVTRDKRLSRRALLVRRVALGLAGVLVAFVLTGWIAAYLHNRSAIAYAAAETERFKTLSAGIPTRNVSDADFLSVLPALDALAGANARFADASPLGFGFGLDQRDKTQGSHRLAYGRALNALLLPRLLVHLQNELGREDASQRETFDALKLYAMLGGLGALDPAVVSTEGRRIFAKAHPGEGMRESRERLGAHLDALIARPIAAIAIDRALVDRARARIVDQSIAERGYDILKGRAEAANLAPWTPASAVGSNGEAAFERTSGASLREGVEGLFTRGGYGQIVLPGVAGAAAEAVDEEWVRGRANPAGTNPAAAAREILALYHAEFEAKWRALSADLHVRAGADLPGMTEVARILASQPPPLASLARSLAEAARLAPPDGADLSGFGVDPGSAPDPFAPLRQALDEPVPGAPAPAEGSEPPTVVSAIQPLIATLYEQLSRAASSSAEVAAIFDTKGQLNEANQALVAEARRLPAPLDAWVGGLAANVDSLAVTTARAQLQSEWQAGGARLCEEAIAGRYPFERSASSEVALDDFARVFGPEGVFETFFRDRLAPFVDTSATPWRWRGTFGAEGRESEALGQFAAARGIREAFFTNGARPSVSINVTPVSLSQDASAVILEIGAGRVAYFHGPIQSRSLTWPEAEGAAQSRVVMQPGGWQNALTRTGPWSAMRLFDAADRETLSDDRFRARFTVSGKSAEFDVQVGSILNPFATDALSGFRCPAGF